MIFGLTGGIASGKSTVTKLFTEAGVPMIDADLVAREVVAPGSVGLHQVVETFGREVLQEDGSLNRPKLGALVFADPEKRTILDGILGGMIENTVAQRAGELAKVYPLVGVDAAILIEKGLHRRYRPVVVVAVDLEIQVQRVMARDKFTEKEARLRIASQLPLEKKVEVADYVIWNNEDLASLTSQAQGVLKQLQLSAGTISPT